MLRALRHRDYALFAAAGWMATIGFWVQRIAVQWIVWDLTESYAWLGTFALVEALGIMVVMPFAGALADRNDRLRLARKARGLEVAVSIAIGMTILLDQATVTSLLVLIALAGFAEGLWSPARLAIVPNLVPKEDLSSALGLGATMFHLSQFVGPVIAGFVIVQFGVGFAFLLTAILFSAMIVVLFVIRLRTSDRGARPSNRFIDDLKDGFRYAFRHEVIGAIMIMGLMISLFLRSYRELLSGYADGLFETGAAGLASLASASGAGALTAALVLANFGATHRLAGWVRWGMLGNTIALAGFALAPSMNLAMAAIAAIGFLVTIAGTGAQILMQHAVPDEKRGRVMSLWGMQFFAGPSLGAWVIGVLASGIGLRVSLLIVAGAFFLYWLVVFQRRRGALRAAAKVGG